MPLNNLILLRANELEEAARDIDAALADLKTQELQLKKARFAIHLEKYQLIESKAPRPLFTFLRGDREGRPVSEARQ